MRSTTFVAVLLSAVSLVSADLVITPIRSDQIVERVDGDCFFGVVTAQGCGPKRD
ncbi:hypothetical protein S7711_00579 [Stachybotrys chartarum IBT 7711]|uniref:Uncharacterized protein n=1 Tax=Stachybotrys chartarum (strain CBS 109288 / IBT 7711) TaxID=1280523 RepID=A0A084ATS6_STACB|nr:hypothetical protein S7711_00579 [Stachybotrys chartarum IBT 7711]KFA49480.1 hypothetical protein S40293_09920 [Stachybotrys chartarum IBT 40293]KFA79297.1 hypothetical protein S40288_03427 [Stachybotrys chartarum IBT 40288]